MNDSNASPDDFAAYLDRLMAPIPSPIPMAREETVHAPRTPCPPTPSAPSKIKAQYMYNSLKCKANLNAKFDDVIVKVAVAEKALQDLKACVDTTKKNLLEMFNEPIDLTCDEDEDYLTPKSKPNKRKR